MLLLFTVVFGTPLLLLSWFVAYLLIGPVLATALTLVIWGGVGYVVVKAVTTPPAPIRVTVVPAGGRRVQPPAYTGAAAAPVLTLAHRLRVAAILAEQPQKDH